MKKIPVILIWLIIVLSLTGCSYEVPEPETTTYEQTSKANEEAVKNLVKNDDLPEITRSLERENIKRRIEFINQPDRIGYLYILTENGQLIMESQVLGKVSSLNSYLTPMEDIQWFRDVDLGEGWGDVPVVTQAPDLDGTYGENANGIFWFTPDGVYQEWLNGGIIVYSSERRSFSSQPVLLEISDN